MLNYTLLNFAAAPVGAASTGARSPWITASAVSAARVNYVRTQNPVQTVGTRDALPAALPPVPAMTMQLTGLGTELPTTFDNRKQTVHKTRINAGGYGAMGPHPEREPA